MHLLIINIDNLKQSTFEVFFANRPDYIAYILTLELPVINNTLYSVNDLLKSKVFDPLHFMLLYIILYCKFLIR